MGYVDLADAQRFFEDVSERNVRTKVSVLNLDENTKSLMRKHGFDFAVFKKAEEAGETPRRT